MLPAHAQEGPIAKIERHKDEDPEKALRLVNRALRKARSGENKVLLGRLLVAKGEINYQLGLFDSVPSLAWEALQYTKKTKKTYLRANFQVLADAYFKLYIPDSSIFYYEKALAITDEKDVNGRLGYLLKLSSLENENGDYTKALKHCIDALKLAESTSGQEKYTAVLYNRIGLIYDQQEDNLKAIQFFRKAKLSHRKLGDSIAVAAAIANVGMAYFNMKLFEKARSNFQKAFEIYSSSNDQSGIAKMQDKLGILEYTKGNFRDALALQNMALRTRLKSKNYRDLPESYIGLANTYLAVKRYDDALDATRAGIEITRKTGSSPQLLDMFRQFYLIYKDLNYKDSALWYHERYEKLKDSIDQRANDELLIRLQSAFETERRQRELIEIKRENEIQEERLNNYLRIERQNASLKALFIVVIIVLLTVAVLFYSRYRIKSRANKVISKKVKENELLLQEVHHRVKNNLQFISSLLSFQISKMNDQEAKELINESIQKVKAMSLVHNRLNFDSETNDDVNLKGFINGLTQSVALSLGLDSEQVQLIYKWRRVSFDIDSFNAIGLVINELITNSFKHCNNEDLMIKIGFHENSKFKMIRYSDNGPGLEKNFFSEGKKMGITLMKLLVEDLGGKLKYFEPPEGEHGIRISINLRKENG